MWSYTSLWCGMYLGAGYIFMASEQLYGFFLTFTCPDICQHFYLDTCLHRVAISSCCSQRRSFSRMGTPNTTLQHKVVCQEQHQTSGIWSGRRTLVSLSWPLRRLSEARYDVGVASWPRGRLYSFTSNRHTELWSDQSAWHTNGIRGAT